MEASGIRLPQTVAADYLTAASCAGHERGFERPYTAQPEVNWWVIQVNHEKDPHPFDCAIYGGDIGLGQPAGPMDAWVRAAERVPALGGFQ